MKIISDKKKIIKITREHKNIGLVPTMGAIHKGHMSLIKKSHLLCDHTIVTIYINKPQFNKKKDYQKYPRHLNKDISILKKNKVDILYLPKTNQIYSKKLKRKIQIHYLGNMLCGKNRPGHFEAVVDIIDRFIQIIQPCKIFFGEKDMQQLKIIEEFIKKKKIKTKVISCKTIREKNGIAYSSRNFLLSSMEKIIASKVYKLILNQKINLIKKKISLNKIKTKILRMGVLKIDYLKIININKLIKPFKKNKKYRIFIAYYLQNVRLIDNI